MLMPTSENRLALPAGFRLRQYQLKAVLGSGGFGITYLAHDRMLGRRVAIKELLPSMIACRPDGTTIVAKTRGEEQDLARARRRFVEEGRALAACEHPNVIHVYEMIEANGTAYMVTKFEEGRSLDKVLAGMRAAPGEGELRALLEPLLSGLERVHQTGFLHRDIKPENIYLTREGRPLLLDFGSARLAVSNRSVPLTSIVSAGYAPYEQYYDDGRQGPWTDLYALAGVIYRVIHGQKPPDAPRRLKTDACVRLAKTYSNRYSAQFLTAIDRALAVEAERRPQSVAAWRSMLGMAPAGDPERTRTAATRERAYPRRPARTGVSSQTWMRIAIALAVVSVLIIGGVLLLSFLSPSRSSAPNRAPIPSAVGTSGSSTPQPAPPGFGTGIRPSDPESYRGGRNNKSSPNPITPIAPANPGGSVSPPTQVDGPSPTSPPDYRWRSDVVPQKPFNKPPPPPRGS
jgi:serine/threonine protein kinase